MPRLPEQLPKLTTVVGAAIVDAECRVLAAQRGAPAELAGFWEFPGGKVESGESDEAALIRECREELGATVKLGERLGEDIHLPTGSTILKVWLAAVVAGEARAFVHPRLRWLRRDELTEVSWLAADEPLVAKLRVHLDRCQPTYGPKVTKAG